MTARTVWLHGSPPPSPVTTSSHVTPPATCGPLIPFSRPGSRQWPVFVTSDIGHEASDSLGLMRPYVETFKTFLTSVQIIFRLQTSQDTITPQLNIQTVALHWWIREKCQSNYRAKPKKKSSYVKIVKESGLIARDRF